MSWQDEALQQIKSAGIPVTASSKASDALTVETTDADGAQVSIVVSRSADTVAEILGYEEDRTPTYVVQAGAYKVKAYALAYAQTIQEHGFDAVVKTRDGMYIVQAGAYKKLDNAKKQVARLQRAGFECIIKTI